MRTLTWVSGVSLCVLFVVGCDDKKQETAKAPKAETTASASASAKPPPVDLGADGKKLLDAWVAAQNDGKFDAYAALYDASFKGVRRTSDGKEKTFDLEGWKTDRKKLFGKKQTVAADNLATKVEDGKVTLTFVQRWKSGKFADHGEKVLELAAKDGGLRIVREELKWSERGFEDGKDKPLDATALVSPITLRVEEIAMPDNGDCSETRLRIHLVDSKGTKLQVDHGVVTAVAGGAKKSGFLKPKDGGFTDLGEYCAGLKQGYTVKVTTDTVVALAAWTDEESGDGKETKVVAKLPTGAKVKLE